MVAATTARISFRGLFMPWELRHVMPASMAAEGLERLRPTEHIASMLKAAPRSGFAKVATLEASLYMRNSCAIRIGQAWRIRSKSACR
jgi:hypothetical protein